MKNKPGALKMSKKLMPKARSLGCTFNKTWNVSHHKALFEAGLDHAKLRRKRCERVICHLRPGIGRRGNKRGFARIGQAEQPHIGKKFQLQPESTRLAWPAWRALSRCSV